jgi:hypothetical protein
MCDIHAWRKAKHIHKEDKPIFSSERMLHKDYYRKSSVEKNLWSWVSRGIDTKTNWLAVNRQS